jgi:hypothetical protein
MAVMGLQRQRHAPRLHVPQLDFSPDRADTEELSAAHRLSQAARRGYNDARLWHSPINRPYNDKVSRLCAPGTQP